MNGSGRYFPALLRDIGSLIALTLLVLSAPGITHLIQAQPASAHRKLVVPKFAKDFVAQHTQAEAQTDPTDAPDGLLSVSQRESAEKGQVIEHSYGGVESQFEQTYVTVNYLRVTAKTDHIRITNVVGNRGNCPLNAGVSQQDLPADLRFGDTLIFVVGCEKLIEIGVQSDRGAMTFNWD